MMLELRAQRILRAERRGSSWPVLVETEAGLFFTKLRGAAQGPATLVAEIIVAEIAERLDLHVPCRALVTIDAETPSDDRDGELADLLKSSRGLNLGFEFLPRAWPIRADQIALIDHDTASKIVWLDAFVMNPDRTARNPNLMRQDQKLWLIDHGAALGFQYRWPEVKEESPQRGYEITRHLLYERATRLRHWDDELRARLTRDVLNEVLRAVPEDFILPLVPNAAFVPRRRAAYVAFLWKRLKASRAFATGRVAARERPNTSAKADEKNFQTGIA